MALLSPSVTIGIDVSSDTLDVAVLVERQVTTSAFANTCSGVTDMIAWLRGQAVVTAPVIIESTGSLHWVACLLLSEAGFSVHLINPLLTKKYQRSSIRNAKSDPIDAKRLAEIGRLEDGLPRFLDTRETLSQRRYHSLLKQLQQTKQSLSRSYHDAIKAADAIGTTLQIDCLEGCLRQLEEAIEVLKSVIAQHADPLAEAAAAIPGISRFQASVLSTAIRHREFANREQLTAFFGLDVAVRRSGKWQGKEKLSKRGNAFYRHILFQIGWSLMMNNPVYKEYYDSLRDRDKHYYTAINATARKFLRQFFRLYREFS